MNIEHYLQQRIEWHEIASNQQSMSYEATIDGNKAAVRMNDFPEQLLYTLLINSHVIGSFNDWPATWSKH